ncbi:MAG: MerR family transcriptional regulator [Chloroflexi bacterium]|nr:MerR family transcriptional regulator [Chloroflexota bacterium]
MLKIGDFSKICQTSIKALRHWDAIGLLKPALTDPETNYRYYSVDQIDAVNRILAFRALGLSLTETAHLLQDRLSPDELRAMLMTKRDELAAQIQQAEATLKVIESRLRVIEGRTHRSPYEVALKSVGALNTVAVRTVVPDMQALVELLEATHPYALAKDNTNLLAIFHDEGYDVESVDVEIGFPVDGAPPKPIALKQGLHMVPTVLPAVPLLASTVHCGEWLTLPEAYFHLGRWIDHNGYTIVGAGREIFHYIDWEDNQRTTVTELQFPISRPA